jgi:hypothetical protein
MWSVRLDREGEAPAEPRTLPARHFNEMRSSETTLRLLTDHGLDSDPRLFRNQLFESRQCRFEDRPFDD